MKERKTFKKYDFLFLLLVASSVRCQSKDQMIEYLRMYNGPHTFLLSYPRSGNTWLRYCLEYLTHCPSFMRTMLKNMRDQPLAWSVGFEIDMAKPPIEKIHIRTQLNDANTHSDNKLILIIRNPKEAITRNEHNLITLEILQGKESVSLYNRAPNYFDNIAIYDEWDASKRLLVYYEDLLTKPRKTLIRILEFLDEPTSGVHDFMKTYKKHQKKCLHAYKEGESNGDLLFHSKNTPPEYRRLIDEWIEQFYPKIWKKYLRHRYSENVLNYTP